MLRWFWVVLRVVRWALAVAFGALTLIALLAGPVLEIRSSTMSGIFLLQFLAVLLWLALGVIEGGRDTSGRLEPGTLRSLLMLTILDVVVGALALGVGFATKNASAAGLGVTALLALPVLLVIAQTIAAHEGRGFCSETLRLLALAMRRGLSVGGALLAASADTTSGRRRRLHRVVGALDEGRPLSEALEAGFGRLLLPATVERLRIGERDGRLADVLESEARSHHDMRPWKSRVFVILTYPAVLLLQGVFVATSILPMFGEIFGQLTDKSGEPLRLPALTRSVLAFHDALFGGGFLVIPAFLLLALYILSRPAARRRFAAFLDPVLLRLPLLGYLARHAAAERVCSALAVRVRAEVPLGKALDSAGLLSGNVAVRESCAAAVRDLQGGVPAYEALANLRVPRFVRVRAAASSGSGPERFAAALTHLADECRRRRMDRFMTIVTWVYPPILLVMAIYVATVDFGIFLPILELQKALI